MLPQESLRSSKGPAYPTLHNMPNWGLEEWILLYCRLFLWFQLKSIVSIYVKGQGLLWSNLVQGHAPVFMYFAYLKLLLHEKLIKNKLTHQMRNYVKISSASQHQSPILDRHVEPHSGPNLPFLCNISMHYVAQQYFLEGWDKKIPRITSTNTVSFKLQRFLIKADRLNPKQCHGVESYF